MGSVDLLLSATYLPEFDGDHVSEQANHVLYPDFVAFLRMVRGASAATAEAAGEVGGRR